MSATKNPAANANQEGAFGAKVHPSEPLQKGGVSLSHIHSKPSSSTMLTAHSTRSAKKYHRQTTPLSFLLKHSQQARHQLNQHTPRTQTSTTRRCTKMHRPRSQAPAVKTYTPGSDTLVKAKLARSYMTTANSRKPTMSDKHRLAYRMTR